MKANAVSIIVYILLLSSIWVFLDYAVTSFVLFGLEEGIGLSTALAVGAVMYKLADLVAYPLSRMVKESQKGE